MAELPAALILSSSWNNDLGGQADPSTGKLIGEFCKTTLKSPKLSDIYCTVLDVKVSEDQQNDAKKFGVTLIPATGNKWADKFEVPQLSWIIYHDIRYPTLRNLRNIQYVIGYSQKLRDAASAIHEDLFPGAKLHLLPSPDQPAATLFVYDAWNKDECGLTGFHRIIVQEFCERKAKAGEPVKVYSTVLDVTISDDQMTDAESYGVTLITAQRKEGIKPKDDPSKLEWLLNHEIYYPDLKKIECIQHVVGYAPKTGYAAADIQRKLFPNAKLVLINHACPNNNCLQATMYGSVEFQEKMLQLAGKANLLFSIGPTIYEYFKNAYRAEILGKQLSEIPHEEILPQAMTCFSQKNPVLSKTRKRHILTYGQLDTQEAINMCKEIAASIETVNQQLQTTPPEWKIQGVSQDTVHTVHINKQKTSQVQLTPHPGNSAKELLISLQQSHLCIPSPVYMDYGFYGLEAVVFGLPTVLLDNTELASFIKIHFDIHEDHWIVGNLGESLHKKILKHLRKTNSAFKKARTLKEDLLKSEAVSESYAKFVSSLKVNSGQHIEEGTKIPHGQGRDMSDSLKVDISLDRDLLQGLKKDMEEMKKEMNVLRGLLKRRVEEVLADESSTQEIKKLCKDKVGDVDPSSLKAESLAIVFRRLTLYHLYKLKQTCRSRGLAKAFEPLLITNEMRRVADKVGITLQLKATYDSEKFRLVELFFINRDGGGIEPLKKYDDVIDEIHIEDDTSDCIVEDGHQHGGDNAKTDVTQSTVGEQSKILVLGFDPKLEFEPSTETNVRTLFNAVKLISYRGKKCDILQVVMAMTDRIQHILSSRLEVLSLLGFVRYLLTAIADEDRRGSFAELEEQLFSYGEQIPLITAYTMSLQARSLLLCQISKRQQTDSDIRYLALAKSQAQSVHSQPDIEKSKFLADKILENRLAEVQKEKSHLEKQCKELLQQREKDEKVITTQRSDNQILKDKVEKLDRNIKYFQSKLKQKDELINELITKSFDAQSNVEVKQIIAESLELGETFPAADGKWEGESIFEVREEATKHTEIRRIDITSAGMQHSGKSRADRRHKPESAVWGQEETPEILATTTETSRPVGEERTTLEEQGATSTETRKIKEKKPGFFGKIIRRLSRRKDTVGGRRKEKIHDTGNEEDSDDEAVSEKIQISDGWSKCTLKGQGPYPGQKYNDPCGLTFHDDKLLVCDRLNNIVQILNQDYTCEKVLGSFSGQFTKPFQPLSVVVSQDNHYFILDDSNLQIVVCDQNNKVISTITLPADVNPYCIALLKGFVLVTDVRGHRLLKYTLTGQFVAKLGSPGFGSTEFTNPFFVAVNSRRDVIMVSDRDNHCIKCFDSDFNYLYQYGKFGAGDSQLYFPFSIAVDGADNVYVCDFGNARISMWSRDGTWVGNLFKRTVSRPSYIAVSRDRICVRGRDDKHITVFSK